MVIYYAPEISPKMFIYIGIGYIFGIIILFNVLMSIIVYFLNVPPGLYFYIIKIGKLKGVALVIYSNQFYLWSILNVLFIIFQSLAPIGYTLVIPILYKSCQLSIKGIFILFSWLNITWPIFFYKFGKDLTTCIKVLIILLSLYTVILFFIFIFKLGVLFIVKVIIIANSPLPRYLI